MNDKLILESWDWIIRNISPNDEFQSRIRAELLGRIDDELNPKVEPTIAEKTHDALSEEKIK